MNLLQSEARMIIPRKVEALSKDPDDFILAIAVSGKADYLASMDLADVISVSALGRTQIVTAREFIILLE